MVISGKSWNYVRITGRILEVSFDRIQDSTWAAFWEHPVHCFVRILIKIPGESARSFCKILEEAGF